MSATTILDPRNLARFPEKNHAILPSAKPSLNNRYLKEENRILREKLGRKRMLLSIEQKRRPATKGKIIGRELLGQCGIQTRFLGAI